MAIERVHWQGGPTLVQIEDEALVVKASLSPDPNNAATAASVASIDTKTPALQASVPQDHDPAAPVRQVPVDFWRCGFAGVGAGLITPDLTLVKTGAGMAVSQSAGNLVITTGTTTNSETVLRSVKSFRGALTARYKAILSQRIVNQIFRFELADQVGTSLAYVINSATSVTVTFPTGTNPFNATNVGQSMRLSNISGAAGIPGRFAIASTSGDTVNFTVAAWPASGSGTLDLYGRNYLANEYSGTTATNSFYDCQRDGWATGATTATIQTTASPGHVAQLQSTVMTAVLSDALVATNAAYAWTPRASRIENVPDEDTVLYLFIIVQNGSVAPASTTTLTVGFVQVECQGRNKVHITSCDQASAPLGLTVNGAVTATISGTPSVSGTVTANQGTYTSPTAYAVNSLATTNLAFIKASAGTLFAGHVWNAGASTAYVKLYNKTTAPTLASDVPVIVIDIPAGKSFPLSYAPTGYRFGTGIAIAIVGGPTDTDATAVAAAQVRVALSYI